MARLILASLEHYVGWYTNDLVRLERAVELDPGFAHYAYTLANHLVEREPADVARGCVLLEQLAAGSVVFPEALERLAVLGHRGMYTPKDPDGFARLAATARGVMQHDDQQLGILRPALVTVAS
jgi:hypothetical protein